MKLDVNTDGIDMDAYIAYIRNVMVEKKIRQVDIAKKTGWAIQTVSNIFAGRAKKATLPVLATIAAAVGCRITLDIERLPDSDQKK